MASNHEIRRLFNLYAELLLLHEKDEQVAGWLSGAAFTMRRIEENIEQLSKEELAKYFRPQILKVLEELFNTGTIEALDELIQLTPTGLFEMMRIKGLGGKKLSVIWKKAKIDSIKDLLAACRKGLLSSLPGFGAKTEKNIILSIESYNDHKDRFHFGFIAEDAERLVSYLKEALKLKLISLCGEVRRQSLTVGSIEILAAVGDKKISASLLKRIMILKTSTTVRTIGQTFSEVPVIIYHTDKSKFAMELFRRTGSDGHVKKILSASLKKTFESEASIYKAAKKAFVVPEMREDVAEWNFRRPVEDLIDLTDIKGVVHNHTTYSDGVNTLAEFVNGCIRKGYEFTVIADHSKNAYYAGGMKEDRLQKQLAEIDELNRKLKPFRIFKSVECDILISGELDYDPSILKKLDLVIISVHQLLKMDEKKATARLIKAIENPFTTILGHMTGRQLLIRPGYPVDFKKVIDACAANNVVIELNANPYRLDMDWTQIPYALEKGVMISINPDAHSIRRNR
jgi:DNA polymerase (family 10)